MYMVGNGEAVVVIFRCVVARESGGSWGERERAPH